MSITSWWYTYPSEKYKFVSWDDEIPNWMERHKNHVLKPPTRIGLWGLNNIIMIVFSTLTIIDYQ